MKVSVIMPVYNMAKYLRDCLETVCNQTIGDYEVICVDDCSPDDSYDVLMELSGKYPCLKVFKQPENMGAGPARNVGLDMATGEYVAFMDADDCYPDRDTLKVMYEAAKANDALIVGGGLRYTGVNAENMQKQTEENSFAEEGWVEYSEYQQYYYYQRFLFKREMLEKNKIRFPHYLRFQDPPFFVRAMLTAGRFYVLTIPAYVYRNDAGHVKWTDAKVTDYMRGVMDIVGMSLERRMEKIYIDMMSRFSSRNKRFSQEILEASLIRGNDNVRDFFKFLAESYDETLLPEDADVDMDYINSMARWNGVRDMRKNHRSIELADAPEADRPLVSVIIPVYNTQDYIRSCVDSVLNQTLKDIEVICIDDGSSDESGRILDEIKENDGRVKVYHQHNQGLSAARNAGVQHVQGRYVYFMDSDDFLEAEALEKLAERAERDRLDILFFGAESFYDDEVTEEDKEKIHLPMLYSRDKAYAECMSGEEMLVQQDKNQEYYTSVCIQFYRTDFLRGNNLAFYEGLLHEDNLFTMTAILKAQRAGCTPETYFKRRIRNNSIMTSKVTHRNMLGYFLTYMELKREFGGAEMDAEVRNVFVKKMREIIRNAVCFRWAALNNAEKALAKASLTAADLEELEVLTLVQENSQAQKDRIKKLLDENSAVRQRLQGAWDEISRQKEMNKTKQERIQVLFGEISRQKEMNSQKQERIRGLLSEIARQKDMNMQKQERIQTLFGEIQRLKDVNSAGRGRIQKLVNEVDRQKKMNDVKRALIRDIREKNAEKPSLVRRAWRKFKRIVKRFI